MRSNSEIEHFRRTSVQVRQLDSISGNNVRLRFHDLRQQFNETMTSTVRVWTINTLGFGGTSVRDSLSLLVGPAGHSPAEEG